MTTSPDEPVHCVPGISVVVTTKNRERRLSALLQSLRNQKLDPQTFELVVVNNASTDGTRELLERAREAAGLHVVPIENSVDRGTGAARNLGWRAARAPLIAFTDDDCEATPDWLSALIDAGKRHPEAVLQGRTEPIPRERASFGPFSRTKKVTSLGPYFETCNIAYPRRLLERLGGFDADAFPSWGGEDTDLAWRALAQGAEAVFVEGALVHHAVNQLGPIGKLRLASSWADSMRVFARHPGLRRNVFFLGVFWKRSHALLLLAVVGALIGRRFPPALLLARPYIRYLRWRCSADGLKLAWAPYMALSDALETLAAARGSARSGILVL
jgi:glycosyltransferase involved in cell wall biosynthesis